MKKNDFLFVRACWMTLSLIPSLMGLSQNPTYENRLMNDSLLDANTYEFDISLIRAGNTPLSWPVAVAGDNTEMASYPVLLPCETNMNDTAAITSDVDNVLNLKFFLEGLYNGSSQMYPVSDGTNYVFGSDVADTFHIELINYANYPPVYKSTNSYLNIEGTVQISVPSIFSGSYFIVIKHRNSIETWSKEPVSFSGSVINYDFSIAASQAAGDNLQNLGSGVYGIYCGDENQDGAVDANDLGDVDNDAMNFVMGYNVSDINGDGIVDSNDLGLIDNNALAFVIYASPPSYGVPCPGLSQITDARDGHIYHTVQIGTQCWLRENLNIGTRIDGFNEQTNNDTIEKYCYNDLEANCHTYGGLYQWNEAMQFSVTPGTDGICPANWHVPTDAEWLTLTEYINSQPSYQCNTTSGWIGKAMASNTLWISSANTCDVGNNLSINNTTGFSGLPAGGYYSYGEFSNAGYSSSWWTSDLDNSNAWYRGLGNDYAGVFRNSHGKENAFSVRCLSNCNTLLTPPTSGTHIPYDTEIIWNWNAVAGATGYKWNTTDDYNTAMDMGNTTSKVESGLFCNTTYTRYAWAYNSCVHSTPVTLIQTTLACWVCGDPLSINHVTSGGVAPVDKSVTYGTATNIPGEPSKCWITRNLGASQQATAVNDATEPSAGWYWQFNRKQGYKHDGSTLTPSWTITSINENSDWQVTNDPCRLELGATWRVPTSTEWYNVKDADGWSNWNGPWNSGLKMHAAGLLSYSNGSLLTRGQSGRYWSTTQSSSTGSWRLYFDSVTCTMGTVQKAYGYSVRCIRD